MATKIHKTHKRLARAALCFLCLFVAASFLTTLLPIANASLTSSSTMPCCAGKADHCDSGITPKQVPPPTSEPMCGLKPATMEDDGITIVAEPSFAKSPFSHSRHAETSLAESLAESDSSRLAVESDSLSQPCRMDCGACLTSLNRQQKRERALVQTSAFRSSSVNTTGRFEYLSLRSSSNKYWEQASPRGPPSAS
jgi:hypothetical protein